MTGAVAVPALRRVIRRRSATAHPGQRCDLCAGEVGEPHRHLLDVQRDEVLCACRACALLFERDTAGRGHYLLIPQRRRRLSDPGPPTVGIPVGLAFFVARPDGAVVARYPSPAGATRWEVGEETWRRITECWPSVREMSPLVEALLVNTARGARESWIVPIDDCYRLVALVRREWRGLAGGSTVWPAVDRFFADLAAPRGSPTATTCP